MAEIRPLRGIRYAPHKVAQPAEVICPPYDELGIQEVFRLYLRHPYNAVRLEFGQEHPTDDVLDNRYTRAAARFTEWLKEGVLRQDEIPAFYVYEQEFRGRTRRGFFALVRLEDRSKQAVFPLVDTRPDAVAERLALFKETHASISPMVGLYADPDQIVAERLMDAVAEVPPFLSFSDELGEGHRLWRLIDRGVIEEIERELEAQPIFLADGAQRYAAALAYRDHLNQHGADAEAGLHNYALMLLVDLEDPGLTFEPTHRLVNAETIPSEFVQRLSDYFDVAIRRLHPELPYPDQVESILAEQVERSEAPSIGMLLGSDLAFYRLTLKPGIDLGLLNRGHTREWEGLSVTVLHSLIFERLLGLSESEWAEGGRVAYARDHREVLVGMGSERFNLAFFLPAPDLSALSAIARQHDALPPKTASLYPKVPAGIVFHHLEGTLQAP